MIQVFQIVLSASILTLSAWLSKKNPEFAGFLIALPIASLLVLPFSYWQHGDVKASITLGQEILKAVPISITFFIPFALADRLHLGFGQAYGLGIGLLLLSYFVVRLAFQPS